MAQKKDYSKEAREFIDKEISHLIKDKNMPKNQAVAVAHKQAKEKGMKVPDQ